MRVRREHIEPYTREKEKCQQCNRGGSYFNVDNKTFNEYVIF
jgi:hypothetical protein